MMDAILDYISYGLLALGCFLGLTGAVGILRMPDFYTRLHPAGKSDSLAQLLIISALVCQTLGHGGGWQGPLKLVAISVFLILTTPAATHAITRAAHLDGLKPWRRDDSKGGAA